MSYTLPEPNLHDVLEYNMASGVFTWKQQRGSALGGGVAGSLLGRHWSIRVFGKTHLAHRLAILYVTGALPGKNVDVEHIDGNRLNNSYANLRLINRTTSGLPLDQAVRDRLEYDSHNGVLRWTKSNTLRFIGCIAGSVNKGNGYVQIRVCRKNIKAHRIVWFLCKGTWPDGDIDHINGNKSDNRIENLRDVTTAVNTQNLRQASKRNKSGFLGVHKEKKRWAAQLRKNGESYWIGTFDTPLEAHLAYVETKRKLHPGCTI